MGKIILLAVAVGSAVAWHKATAASDCVSEGHQFTQAYKAYNDCSAAGRGAAGCANETRAYDAVRTRLDSCHEQRRAHTRPSFWVSGSNKDDEERGSWARERFEREPPPARPTMRQAPFTARRLSR